jgi:predicted ester cyclase
MKKLLFLFTIGVSSMLISCKHNEAGMSETATKNQETMRAIMKCFDSKDFSKLGDYIAEDAVDHAGEQGDLHGLAEMKVEFEKWSASTLESKSEPILEMANDEYAMVWARFTGTMKTEAMGMKAGDKFDMKSIELSKFKNGKATEHWTFMEPAEMMKMMGGSMPPAAADSSKKEMKDSTKKM